MLLYFLGLAPLLAFIVVAAFKVKDASINPATRILVRDMGNDFIWPSIGICAGFSPTDTIVLEGCAYHPNGAFNPEQSGCGASSTATYTLGPHTFSCVILNYPQEVANGSANSQVTMRWRYVPNPANVQSNRNASTLVFFGKGQSIRDYATLASQLGAAAPNHVAFVGLDPRIRKNLYRPETWSYVPKVELLPAALGEGLFPDKTMAIIRWATFNVTYTEEYNSYDISDFFSGLGGIMGLILQGIGLVFSIFVVVTVPRCVPDIPLHSGM
jgi:hypothetical protein